MQRFPNMLSSVTLLQDDKEDKSYDVELLFANILPPLVWSTLHYQKIIDKTYCTFKFNNEFLKQVDGCA